jgi:hypothetical protein
MGISKGSYLRRITTATMGQTREVDKNMEGSSPPSVFIGSWNYPKVYAGPMIAPVQGECGIMDTPESWIPGGLSQEEILSFRLGLVRGKRLQDVTDTGDRFVGTLQEIALSDTSRPGEAVFSEKPTGQSFSEEHSPFGPSAHLLKFETEEGRWETHLEKAYYDDDLTAGDAIFRLHADGVPFSSIQKALSVGALGTGPRRKLVPTRWSITACDTALANRLLTDVKRNPVIDSVRVHRFSSLHNHYAVILLPTAWNYEWTEAFLRIVGNEEMVFSDHEGYRGKKEYSSVGGCYYSCKMAVLEALARQGVQAGAIVLREARHPYIPLGVFNVRENVRGAMQQPYQEFEDLKSALTDIGPSMELPMSRFVEEGTLLRNHLRARQTTLDSFGT